MRSYKADTPENTIERITQIFNSMDITVHQETFDSIDGILFSCSYSLDGIQYLAQNGKGNSREFAIAGALAEMMERLQNLISFAFKIGMDKTEILRVIPDMIEIDNLDMLYSINDNECGSDIRGLCDELLISSSGPIYADKFYDVKNDTVVLLPHPNIITTTRSNGMCAGNTPAEAIVQGICEILERESLKQIYAEHVIPPTIPEEFIKNGIAYKIIETLANKDISIIVKDCSLGRDFPVVGAIAVNKVTGQYKFAIGSHPVFDYALERTLTELYQGFGEEEISKLGNELLLGNDPFADIEAGRDVKRTVNFANQVVRGRGELPESIFYKKPTYEFEPWDTFDNSASYEEDLKIFKELIISNGSNIYIKDLSFLNFPTYYVYIPRYSPLWYNHAWTNTGLFKKIYELSRTTDLRAIYDNLMNSSVPELLDMITFIDSFLVFPEILEDDKPIKWLQTIFHSKISKEYVIAPEYLLALLYHKVENYEESYKKMDDFFNRYGVKRESQKYLFAFRDALFLLSKKYKPEEIETLLSNYYHKNCVSTVMTMLTIKNMMLMTIKSPKPADYKYYDACKTIFDKIRQKVKDSSINQYAIRDYFW
jgi:ribosomal protein S12 methylthiotransferase accessory factor